MSVRELVFKTEGEELIFTYENNTLILTDKNLDFTPNTYEFDRGEAHLLYLYLKERFER